MPKTDLDIGSGLLRVEETYLSLADFHRQRTKSLDIHNKLGANVEGHHCLS
jgi:hypothetical protein